MGKTSSKKGKQAAVEQTAAKELQAAVGAWKKQMQNPNITEKEMLEMVKKKVRASRLFALARSPLPP